jgi:hypothetical protein
VLNAGGTGIVQGFRIAGGGLRAIPHSARRLGWIQRVGPFYYVSNTGSNTLSVDGIPPGIEGIAST